jgi:biopolymer transport protein ExbD
MRMRRYRQQEHESQHGIDLAPMLDFVLNLLIFFIITAMFVKEVRARGQSPVELRAVERAVDRSITVGVFANGEISVDGRTVDLRAVRANIERARTPDNKGGVLLVAEPGAKNGLVIETADQVRQGGITDITFSTSE